MISRRNSDGYQLHRDRMVREHIEARGVAAPRVLEVMRQVPRHLFVPEKFKAESYRDFALPIACEQTISQPFVVAKMTELLEVEPEHSVLEIGTGSGYQTLVLACLAGRVYSLERVAELARKAIERLRPFRLDNVKIQAFDGTVGWSEVAPFDRILVTAGAPRLPEPLVEQLVVGGRLVLPEGSRDEQRLVVYEKRPKGLVRTVGPRVSFVPLIGRHGWQRDDRAERGKR